MGKVSFEPSNKVAVGLNKAALLMGGITISLSSGFNVVDAGNQSASSDPKLDNE
jgi:hypothetical protein